MTSAMHPGEILKEEFMLPLRLTANRLAFDIHVPPTQISRILHGRRPILPETALRLERYFGVEAEFWLNLQKDYDLRTARALQKKRIDEEVSPRG